MNARQRLFAEEYAAKPNATQAAIGAGYSERTAYSQGQRLLKNVEVAALVEELRAERSKRTEISADRVLKEVGRLAFTDLADYAEWGDFGFRLKASAELSPDESAAITEVAEQGRGSARRLKIKLGHKDSALRMLMEHLGLLDNGAGDDPAKLADTFLAGAEAMRKTAQEVPDLSE